jgi:hypothetical protein
MIAEPHALNISVTRIVLPYLVYTFVGIRISILYRLALWLGGKEWLIQMKLVVVLVRKISGKIVS